MFTVIEGGKKAPNPRSKPAPARHNTAIDALGKEIHYIGMIYGLVAFSGPENPDLEEVRRRHLKAIFGNAYERLEGAWRVVKESVAEVNSDGK